MTKKRRREQIISRSEGRPKINRPPAFNIIISIIFFFLLFLLLFCLFVCLAFLSTVKANQSEEHITWLHNYAVIRLYKEFEGLMLDVLVAAVNNDTSTLEATTDVKFPKHLTDEVCEFLITGTGYFDFKGRSGLIKTLKSFVPDAHYLVATVKKPTYTVALDQLSTLRNFAAHESQVSKRAALEAIGATKLAASGAWLKKRSRFDTMAQKLKALSSELHGLAPY